MPNSVLNSKAINNLRRSVAQIYNMPLTVPLNFDDARLERLKHLMEIFVAQRRSYYYRGVELVIVSIDAKASEMRLLIRIGCKYNSEVEERRLKRNGQVSSLLFYKRFSRNQAEETQQKTKYSWSVRSERHYWNANKLALVSSNVSRKRRKRRRLF